MVVFSLISAKVLALSVYYNFFIEIAILNFSLFQIFDVKGFKVGTSYDFTVSKFKAAGPGTGAAAGARGQTGQPRTGARRDDP